MKNTSAVMEWSLEQNVRATNWLTRRFAIEDHIDTSLPEHQALLSELFRTEKDPRVRVAIIKKADPEVHFWELIEVVASVEDTELNRNEAYCRFHDSENRGLVVRAMKLVANSAADPLLAKFAASFLNPQLNNPFAVNISSFERKTKRQRTSRLGQILDGHLDR